MYVLVRMEEAGLEKKFGFLSTPKPSGLFRRMVYEVRFLISYFKFRHHCANVEILRDERPPKFPVLVLERPISQDAGGLLKNFHHGCEAVVEKHRGIYYVVCSDNSSWYPGVTVSIESV